MLLRDCESFAAASHSSHFDIGRREHVRDFPSTSRSGQTTSSFLTRLWWNAQWPRRPPRANAGDRFFQIRHGAEREPAPAIVIAGDDVDGI